MFSITMGAIYKRIAGIDVHRMKHAVTVLIESDDGTVTQRSREFGGFKRDLKQLVAWLPAFKIELAILESTGIYWKSVFAHLEAVGIPAWVVDAHYVKRVPGRKTDIADSEWLAQLGCFGLVRGSFIPSNDAWPVLATPVNGTVAVPAYALFHAKDLRELRLVSRYRKKLAGVLAGEKNRLHKLLNDVGIKLGGVVSDINGGWARRIIEGLIAGRSPAELATLGLGSLEGKREVLAASLKGDLSPRHRLLQTIPGIGCDCRPHDPDRDRGRSVPLTKRPTLSPPRPPCILATTNRPANARAARPAKAIPLSGT